MWRGLLLLCLVVGDWLCGFCAASGPATLVASDCCEAARRVRLPVRSLAGWYWTSKVYCRRQAVIFLTRPGRKVCAWPDARTRRLMARVPELSFQEKMARART
ncbi:RF4.1 [Retroperitoneal fibromatosis-associated herpesvirus]|uniref:RF4.1 n=1 Tax=Retroperitoneal fibromatosis-associated herpesvirus TaxID=111469 RepID=U5NIB6_9GAMA|nr:RF4.1 [Retroperitoneal fibromatosis-associated herpesvirus]AGY30695.1 RF4.1 [Retroperitoneal fibromatosis-associated herpesvirus]